MTEPMRVVSGALVDDGRVLFGLRKLDRLRPGLWEMPGGKIEHGENSDSALRREWLEELQIDVEVGELITVASIEVEVPIIIYLYEVTCATVPIRAFDHDAIRMIDPLHAVRRFPCSPGVYLHFAALKYWMIARRTWVGRES